MSRTTRRTSAARAGFTMIEIMVVVTIIAVLAALIVPRLWNRLDVAKRNVAKAEAKALRTAVELYLTDSGETLSSNFDLSVLVLPPEDGGGPEGPYLNKEEDLYDPWENAYAIRVPGDVNYDFDIVSFGPDEQEGTEDDIVN